jgi:flagellar basal body-associated protein FliL
MVAKKGNRIFIIVVSAIILVGGGITYLLYWYSKKGEVKDEVTEDGIKTDEVITPSSSGSSSSSGSRFKWFK